MRVRGALRVSEGKPEEKNRIFVSYRREDSAYAAGRLYDRLSQHFASDQVFMDIDAIDLGIDFQKKIDEAMNNCDVVIAVIGRNWLNATDSEGRRRLDNPDDFVRLELAAALTRDVPLIPVFVDGAGMPRAGKLPKDLSALVRRNGLAVGHPSFRADSDRLIKGLEAILADRKSRAKAVSDVQALSKDSSPASDSAMARDVVATRFATTNTSGSGATSRVVDSEAPRAPGYAFETLKQWVNRLRRRRALVLGGILLVLLISGLIYKVVTDEHDPIEGLKHIAVSTRFTKFGLEEGMLTVALTNTGRNYVQIPALMVYLLDGGSIVWQGSYYYDVTRTGYQQEPNFPAVRSHVGGMLAAGKTETFVIRMKGLPKAPLVAHVKPFL